MSRIYTGKIKGKIIRLEEDPQLPENEVVKVRIKPDHSSHFKKALGKWKNDPEMDKAFEKIAKDRHSDKISRERS